MNDRQHAKYNSHLALRHYCEKEANRAFTSSLSTRVTLYKPCLFTPTKQHSR
jgi:hypothetical protein